MEKVFNEARGLAGWYLYVIRYELRELWLAVPGPWYVKLLLIAVCSLIPGCGDEIALIALTAYARRRRARKLAVVTVKEG